uniref:ATP synthase complex subunit 8 n=2 Tax=Stephanolepis TaxID=143347 RepID=A0AA51GGL8_9TELE|nr:ATP synthase F0 subunit 8 [Stephanolepis cirrhifer]YP_010948250.1 ATP synthase F0 subunit 8 [Stephanolepis hispida]WMI35343.1 ATP synthase F0 subunit 8 [Stephanolepis hispida]WMI35447.1 ATP synthase F0 subunit 8 [Stephanolepis hispida]BAB70460.1 ATPase subunit 8 [Stephanolepis cirrhifer]
MPQLDPAPWLMILVLSWSILLTVIPPKVLSHTFPNTPNAQSAEKLETNPWTWLWH